MRSEDSLATILLASRICSEGMEPLRAAEYWKLRTGCAQPGALMGRGAQELVRDYGLPSDLAARVVMLLGRVRAMGFELEQLEHAGIVTVTPFDEHYPRRLIECLGSKAPALLHAAGDVEMLNRPGVGVVGSRDVSDGGARAAERVAEWAAQHDYLVISGGARGWINWP